MFRRKIKNPYISEKATELTQNENVYVFEVEKGAGKKEVKREIELFYKVDVKEVRMIRIPPKKRRVGRIEGERKGFKKALVKVKEGQKIETISS